MLTIRGRKTRSCDGLSRRELIKVGALSVGGLTLADLLRFRAQGGTSSSDPPKSIIMIYLGGGPAHIDMYDLKPDAPAEIRGEFRPIHTNVSGFDICGLMPLQAKIADKLALVRNLQMGTSDHNNLECMTGYLFGREVGRPAAKPRPSLGSVISRLGGSSSTIPAYVSLMTKGDEPERFQGENPAYLGNGHRPFRPRGEDLDNLGPPRALSRQLFEDRQALLQSFDSLRRDLDSGGEMESMDTFRQRALSIVASDQTRAAFDLTKESPSVRDRYGRNNDATSQAFLQARRLIEAGVRVVTVTWGSWDTHGFNFTSLRNMLPALDRALCALVTDLHDRGLAKNTAVLVWGEFGRTPRIDDDPTNKSRAGRGHWGPANFALFAGGFKTGQVIGATDAYAAHPKGNPVSPQNVLASLYRFLEIDPSLTFRDDSGRPMPLLDQTEPIDGLL